LVKQLHQKLNIFKKYYKNSAEYKISLYAIFMERALSLCEVNGVQSFIVPDSFLLGKYFSKIRKYILENSHIEKILLLSQSVFGVL
jgi:adenine-specific DNA-methyltransferase